MAEAQPHAAILGGIEAHGQAAFGLAIGAEPGWQGGALFGGGAGLAQGCGQEVQRGAGGIAEMVEQHHH